MKTLLNIDADKHKSQPMFFGPELGLQRYDKVKYPIFLTLAKRMRSYFWLPDEVDLAKDIVDFERLDEGQKEIFTKNLSYQILLDSLQGRAPTKTFGEIVSIPELEPCLSAWEFMEGVHSLSYTHIIENLYPDASIIYDNIQVNEEIRKRAKSVSKYYNDLYILIRRPKVEEWQLHEALIKALVAVNILEGIRFYVSFACTFAMGENKLMTGNTNILKLIARDEAVHLSLTQHILNLLREREGLGYMFDRIKDHIVAMFVEGAEEEKAWADYLFRDTSLIGLNAPLLHQYIEYLTNQRGRAIGIPVVFADAPVKNPLPWMDNWLGSKSVQVAPQETEITSYLVSSVKHDVIDLAGVSL